LSFVYWCFCLEFLILGACLFLVFRCWFFGLCGREFGSCYIRSIAR
jgi:hypothetical protein